MTKKTALADAPKYVLKSGNQPVAPTVILDDSKKSCVCVYGFSDKRIFDEFNKNSKEQLTPYPLVTGYLANQISAAEAAGADKVAACLVILDAKSPTHPIVSAATMAAVLDGQHEKAKEVPIELELAFNSEKCCYLKHDS